MKIIYYCSSLICTHTSYHSLQAVNTLHLLTRESRQREGAGEDRYVSKMSDIMPGEDRYVSKMSDILPKSGSFDNIVELSMDMIAQGFEGERRDLHANKMESRTPQFAHSQHSSNFACPILK